MSKAMRVAFLVAATLAIGAGLLYLNNPLEDVAWAGVVAVFAAAAGGSLLEVTIVSHHRLLWGFLPQLVEAGGVSLMLALAVYIMLPPVISVYFSVCMVLMLLITLKLSLEEGKT